MNKKMMKKIVISLLITILLCSSYSLISLATYSTIDIDYITEDAADDSGAADSVLSIVQAILTVVQVVAIGMAIIIIIVLAIKYMTSAPADKADIKKSATAYIVGAVILFSTAGILGIIRKFSETNIKPVP